MNSIHAWMDEEIHNLFYKLESRDKVMGDSGLYYEISHTDFYHNLAWNHPILAAIVVRLAETVEFLV